MATTAVVILLGGIFMIRDVMAGSGDLRLAGSPYLPVQASEVSVDRAFYDDLRDPRGGSTGLPSIEAQVITGPFVRLFIPYRPARTDARLQARCPGLQEVGPVGVRLVRSSRADSTRALATARSRDALACAAGLWTVTLNGAPVDTPPVFGRHPDSGVRGLQYMVPTRELPVGRQLLRITEVPGPDATRDTAPRDYPIIFWWGPSN